MNNDIFVSLALEDTEYFLENMEMFELVTEQNIPRELLAYIEHLHKTLNTTNFSDNTLLSYLPDYLKAKEVNELLIPDYIGGLQRIITSEPLLFEDVENYRRTLCSEYTRIKTLAILTMAKDEYSKPGDLEDVQKFLTQLEEIHKDPRVTQKNTFLNLFQELPKRYEELNSEDNRKVFLTGYPKIDETIKAQKGDVCTIGAAPKVGKSTLLRAITCNSVRQKYRCAYISLEEGKKKLLPYLENNFANKEITPGAIGYDYYKELITKGSKNVELEDLLYIKCYPKDSVTIDQIFFDIKKSDIKPDIVFIDYTMLALVSAGMKNYDKGDVTFNRLGYWAKTMDVVVWTAHQLNRDAINNMFAGMENVGDSLKIIQHADVIITLRLDKDNYKINKLEMLVNQRSGASYKVITCHVDRALCKLWDFEGSKGLPNKQLEENEEEDEFAGSDWS